jgi:KEOPS complex subunit Cgi121
MEDFHRHVAMAGFRNVKITGTDDFLSLIEREKPLDTEIQVLDSELVATWQHLYFAVLNALTSFKNRQNISRSLAMEIMLYASAQRQIRKATEVIGVRPESKEIAVLIISKERDIADSALSRMSGLLDAERDDTVLELSQEKIAKIQRAFEVSDEEIRTVMKGNRLAEALVDLVIEKMALLAINH